MRTIRFRDSSLQFPQACAYCLNGVYETISFDRTFTFGKHSQMLKLPVPLCSDHASQARKKSIGQIWCERAAWVTGILAEITVAVGLFLYWHQSSQGWLILNIPLAFFIGACLGITFWAVPTFYIVPLLAAKNTKSVLQSVHMTRYDPYRNMLEVRFVNEIFAELTARCNLSLLDIDITHIKRYHLSAAIHSDDVRLNGSLNSDVLLDHYPTRLEALDLLDPPAKAVMVQHMGLGSFYEIYVTEIQEVPTSQ